MKLSAITPALIAAGVLAVDLHGAASSSELQARQETGSMTVPQLGARKKQVIAAGATPFDLAIAMLETNDMNAQKVSIRLPSANLVRKTSANRILQHQYAYGDNKQDDSANFGIFKQNWGVLRACCSRFKGQSQSSWNDGAVLK